MGELMASEINQIAFEVYPKTNSDGTLIECPIYTLSRIITSLGQTEYQGYISPLHVPDSISEHHYNRSHFHVLLNLNGRFSQKSVKETLDACGVEYANRKILPIYGGREGFLAYARYLLHLTRNSEHKQQYSKGTCCFSINLPLHDYLKAIAESNYQSEVIKLIKELKINSPALLLDAVDICLHEYYQLVWRDLNKWVCFFMNDRLQSY